MKTKIFIIMTLSALLLTACAKKQPQELTIIDAFQATPYSANNIRVQALQETALGTGAQAGLAWRAHQINKMLKSQSQNLDRVFNFNGLILKNNVLPPVLVEGDDSLNLASPIAVRLADKIYKIQQPPQFVTVAPTWRDYLLMNYEMPGPPDSTLLPKTAEERQVWNKCIKIGWQKGIDQANEIFSINLGRLKRDYLGMILYRKLLAQNMVTPPYVAKLDLGVTGGGNSMRVNDQVLRITATSQLNANAQTWKPVIKPGDIAATN